MGGGWLAGGEPGAVSVAGLEQRPAAATAACQAEPLPPLPLLLQDLMKAAPDVTNVVAACCTEGRQERLEGMRGQLELCEKALQVGCCRC